MKQQRSQTPPSLMILLLLDTPPVWGLVTVVVDGMTADGKQQMNV